MNIDYILISYSNSYFEYFVGELRLESGAYVYTFQCVLPPNLPTSIETTCGYIRYTARVVIDNPRWPDKTFAVPFTVIKTVDLNKFPTLRVI